MTTGETVTMSTEGEKGNSNTEARTLRIQAAVSKVQREFFIDPSLRSLAYADYPLPIGSDQTISSVETVIRLCLSLKIVGGERVLEIGTGSGYQAAILTELGCRVFSIEKVAELSRVARKVLDRLGYERVLVQWGDGGNGWPRYAPYDRILLTAACPAVPPPLFEQLDSKGIMVVPLGPPPNQRLVRVFKDNSGSCITEELESCNFVPLVGKWGWDADSLATYWGRGEASQEEFVQWN